MKWITRERVKVDRVACPWLIRKFVDLDRPRLGGSPTERLSRPLLRQGHRDSPSIFARMLAYRTRSSLSAGDGRKAENLGKLPARSSGGAFV